MATDPDDSPASSAPGPAPAGSARGPQPDAESEPLESRGSDPEPLSTDELIDRLREDQLWLLRQLDAGRWPEWRLDLAALERELDQLLNQLSERQG
jgi:hypothetical protein